MKIQPIHPLCEESTWENGTCCCNCIHQKKLVSHPWNTSFGKGAMSEQCGWVCTVWLDPEMEQKNPVVQFYDFEHGECELHVKTKEYKEAIQLLNRSNGVDFW